MSALSDILALLDHWPTWKAMTAAPARIAELEARIVKLEAASAKRSAGATIPCPLCGTEMKITKITPHHIFGGMGVQEREFKCQCGHTEGRLFDPREDK